MALNARTTCAVIRGIKDVRLLRALLTLVKTPLEEITSRTIDSMEWYRLREDVLRPNKLECPQSLYVFAGSLKNVDGVSDAIADALQQFEPITTGTIKGLALVFFGFEGESLSNPAAGADSVAAALDRLGELLARQLETHIGPAADLEGGAPQAVVALVEHTKRDLRSRLEAARTLSPLNEMRKAFEALQTVVSRAELEIAEVVHAAATASPPAPPPPEPRAAAAPRVPAEPPPEPAPVVKPAGGERPVEVQPPVAVATPAAPVEPPPPLRDAGYSVEQAEADIDEINAEVKAINLAPLSAVQKSQFEMTIFALFSDIGSLILPAKWADPKSRGDYGKLISGALESLRKNLAAWRDVLPNAAPEIDRIVARVEEIGGLVLRLE